MINLEQVLTNLINFNPIWSSLIKFEQVLTNLNIFEHIWRSWIQFKGVKNKFEHVWSMWSKFKQIWSSLIQFDQFVSSLKLFDHKGVTNSLNQDKWKQTNKKISNAKKHLVMWIESVFSFGSAKQSCHLWVSNFY